MDNPAIVKYEPTSMSDTEEDIQFEAEVEILSEHLLDIKTEQHSLFLGADIKEETSESQKGEILRKLLTKEGEHEAIPQVWVKQEIKEEPPDPSQAAGKQKSESMPDSPYGCIAENESLINGNEGNYEEEIELQDVKSVCETEREEEPSASDERAPSEFLRMKYCCKQSVLLGKNCDICKKPMVKNCCRENMLLGKNCDICKKLPNADKQNFSEFSREEEPSLSDEQTSIEFRGMKYCCKQSMLLGKDCDICNKPMVKNCCRQNMLLGKSCDICNMPIDALNKLYWCKICDTGYSTRYRLQTHMSVHRDKKFQCHICQKFFLNQHNLDKHKQSMHCTEKYCVCPTCGKGFKGKFALKRHIVCHSGKRDHFCLLCNKSFKMSAHLVNHKLFVHGDERKCLCAICGKGFKTNFVLRRHLLSHSSERS